MKSTKKQPSMAKTPTAPTAKRLALKKDALKDLSAGRAAHSVKAGAYTRLNGTCTCFEVG